MTGRRAAKKASGRAKSGRRPAGKRQPTKKKRAGKRSRGAGFTGRFQTLLVILVLMGTGALIASFWLEWRQPRLGVADGPAADASIASAADSRTGLEDRLRIEVLNGSGDRGAAERMAQRLRGLGFDVVYWGNADSFEHGVTHVINRSGYPGVAGEIADALGTDSVATEIDAELHLDATVILGKDWQALAPRRPVEPAPESARDSRD